MIRKIIMINFRKMGRTAALLELAKYIKKSNKYESK